MQALRILTAKDGSLAKRWLGRLYNNPPYGRARGKGRGRSQQAEFLRKALREYRAGHATEVILLLKAAIGYRWLRKIWCLPHGVLYEKVAFVPGAAQAGSGNPHGSIVVYLGPNVQRFAEVFAEVAAIPGKSSWHLPQGLDSGSDWSDSSDGEC